MQKREQRIPLLIENTLVNSEGQILGTDRFYKAQQHVGSDNHHK